MADINIKYKKLADDAMKLIELDNAIIDAIERGDKSMIQPMYVNRAGLIRQIQDLAKFKP